MSLWPASISRRAIGCPILPSPMKPMSMKTPYRTVMLGRFAEKFRPNFLAVLAERGDRPVLTRRTGKNRRRRRSRHRAARRADLDAAQMRMDRQQCAVIDACEGDIGRFQHFH